MSKVFVVFGATGQQGGSIADFVINDSELSKQFKVRGVTRDASKPAAKTLEQKGIEMISADADDVASLKRAMAGAHTVFAMNMTVFGPQAKEVGLRHGHNMADAAVSEKVSYLIWSTVPSPNKVSGGKYPNVGFWDDHEENEQYIRSLPIKSSFFAPASFMQNFTGLMKPRPNGDGSYSLSNVVTGGTRYPLIETASDSGKYVGAILANPDFYEGKVLSCATAFYSLEEIAQIMSKSLGKSITYKQTPDDVYLQFAPRSVFEMHKYIQDFGYYGPESEKLVAETARQARGKLTTMEEFIAKNPPQLD